MHFIAIAAAIAADYSEMVERVRPSIALLTILTTGGETAAATGFVVGDGSFLVTNFHVVSDALMVTATFPDGEPVVVSGMVAADPDGDLALLRLPKKRPPIMPADAIPKDASLVLAVGNPKGLGLSFSDGIVSGIREVDGYQLVQHTAPISPGNSGGPLLNSEGQFVGINAASLAAEDTQNVNFAIGAGRMALLWERGASLIAAGASASLPGQVGPRNDPASRLISLQHIHAELRDPDVRSAVVEIMARSSKNGVVLTPSEAFDLALFRINALAPGCVGTLCTRAGDGYSVASHLYGGTYKGMTPSDFEAFNYTYWLVRDDLPMSDRWRNWKVLPQAQCWGGAVDSWCAAFSQSMFTYEALVTFRWIGRGSDARLDGVRVKFPVKKPVNEVLMVLDAYSGPHERRREQRPLYTDDFLSWNGGAITYHCLSVDGEVAFCYLDFAGR
jgi:hypothetical protein